MQTEVNLPYITAADGVPKHLNVKISRSKFESLVDDLIQRTVSRQPYVEVFFTLLCVGFFFSHMQRKKLGKFDFDLDVQ